MRGDRLQAGEIQGTPDLTGQTKGHPFFSDEMPF